MRVLLDNNVNQRFARLLSGHEVIHARQMGWSALSNGNMLASGEADGFDVLITADKSMQYQQTMADRKISVILLNALLIKWEYIEPLAPQVLRALDANLPQGFFLAINPEHSEGRSG
jgi:predicted nuclease of predicted toxin-antitoxin system